MPRNFTEFRVQNLAEQNTTLNIGRNTGTDCTGHRHSHEHLHGRGHEHEHEYEHENELEHEHALK
jgi:ABC-type Zn2+ transport system substrate-binding protein/surface adhesin